MSMRKGMILWLMMAAAGWCMATEWQVPVVNYSSMNYGAGTQNWQMTQGENGWIYAANHYGVLEYDGNNWRIYGVRNSTTIRSVWTDGGLLYAGATNEFGVFQPDTKGRLQYQSLSEQLAEDDKDFGEVWSITQVGDILYFQARHHIFRLESDGTLSVIRSDARLYCCAEQDGGLYVATQEGIAILSGMKLVMLNQSEILHGSEIRSLRALDKDRLLIGTDFRGLYVLENNIVKPFVTDADDFLKTSQLYTTAISRDRIAVGTVLNGLVTMDKQGHDCQYISRGNGLQNNTVLSLYYDREENLWAGLDQGIDCVLFASATRHLTDGVTSYGAGYASCIYHGALYLGTNQGLYYVADFDASHPERLLRENIEFIEGSQGQVWSLCEIEGRLLCCHNRGLYEVRQGHLYALCEEEGFWRIRQIDENRWIAGTYRGFYLIDKSGVRRLDGIDETALHYEVDAQGVIWLCTLHGLIRATLNEAGDVLTPEYIYRDEIESNYVNIARSGKEVYIASTDFVFKVFEDGSTDADWIKQESFRSQYGFSQADSWGGTWYCKNDELHYLDADGTDEMLMHRPYFVPGFASLTCLSKGCALIGGFEGFHLVKTQGKNIATSGDKLYIRSIECMSEKDMIIYGESGQETVREITLRPEENSLRFTFGTAFSEGEKTFYRTRLLPQEKEFGPWADFHIREYRSLRHGRYTLEVEAQHGDDILTTSIQVTIRAHWYESIVAYVIYGLLFVLGIALFILWVIRHIRRSQREFEREKLAELQASQLKILELENEKAQMELQSKSQELSNLLLNRISRNELAGDVLGELKRVTDNLQEGKTPQALKRIRTLSDKLARDTGSEVDWKRFEENFDLINASFLQRLSQQYPWMVKNEKKLCVYIKMGLLTKEIAPLMGITARGVEMMRYRLRQKMDLDAQANLKEYLESLSQDVTD